MFSLFERALAHFAGMLPSDFMKSYWTLKPVWSNAQSLTVTLLAYDILKNIEFRYFLDFGKTKSYVPKLVEISNVEISKTLQKITILKRLSRTFRIWSQNLPDVVSFSYQFKSTTIFWRKMKHPLHCFVLCFDYCPQFKKKLSTC